MKKAFLSLIILGLVSCSISYPQATPLLVSPLPAITNHCSDRGWTDIANHVFKIRLLITVLHVGNGMAGLQSQNEGAGFLEQLRGLKDKINIVDIDACSEHARQALVRSLENYILWQYSLLVVKKLDPSFSARARNELKNAEDELKSLGISCDVNYL